MRLTISSLFSGHFTVALRFASTADLDRRSWNLLRAVATAIRSSRQLAKPRLAMVSYHDNHISGLGLEA